MRCTATIRKELSEKIVMHAKTPSMQAENALCTCEGMHAVLPFGGACGKSAPSFNLMRNCPPWKGVSSSHIRKKQRPLARFNGSLTRTWSINDGLNVSDVFFARNYADSFDGTFGAIFQFAKNSADDCW
jgi:hypothetical protein